MKNTNILIKTIALSVILMATSCKKNKDTPSADATPTPVQTKKYALVIENGAQSIEVGKSVNLSAHLVNSSGAVVNVSGLSWSSNIGGISGTTFSLNNDTTGIISASIQYEGVTYSASVPINIQPVKSTQLFAVVPSAVIWGVGVGTIQLETIYLGGTATYTFTSQNTGIVSVSSTGLLTFNAVGNTNIIVKATINGQVNTTIIPVLVVGEPEAPLPVTRIVVTPVLGELFRGETLQLNAKAYNSAGTDVSSTVTFSYLVVPKIEDDNEPANAIMVNGTGLVTASAIGGAYVKVTAAGLQAQSEIIVNPDTTIIVNPFYASLGGIDPFTFLPNPDNATFTATTYKVNRAAYKAGNPSFLTQIPNPSNLTWEIPTTGIAEIDNVFNVVTLSNVSNTSAKATAIAGKAGATFIVAYSGAYGCGAGIMVMP